jgi:hypothetical protein
MVLTHDLHGRFVRVAKEAHDRVGEIGLVQGVCYADNEATIMLLVEMKADGQLELFQFRQVRLLDKSTD